METIGNALEAECYSETSSATVISLCFISITSLYIGRETGIEPATSSLGSWHSGNGSLFHYSPSKIRNGSLSSASVASLATH
jgi:hypothetical protein